MSLHPIIGLALSGFVPVDHDQCDICRRQDAPLAEAKGWQVCDACRKFIEEGGRGYDARVHIGDKEKGYDA